MNTVKRLRTYDVIRARASDSIHRVMEAISDEYGQLDPGDSMTIKTILARNMPRGSRFRDVSSSAGTEEGRRASMEVRASVEAVQAMQQANRKAWP